MSDTDRYDVNIVFRGLVLAQPVNNRLAILLPDARTPQRLVPEESERRVLAVKPKLTREQERRKFHGVLAKYREHHAMLEFRVADWSEPRIDLPQAVRLKRQGEDEALVCLIGGDQAGTKTRSRLRFLSSTGKPLALPAALHGEKGDYNHTLASSAQLQILEGSGARSYHHLPPFRSSVDGDAWKESIAFATFDSGEVYSDRQCRDGAGPLLWVLSPVSMFPRPPARAAERAINLDLHVRFSLSREEKLRIRIERVAGGAGGTDEQVPFFPRLAPSLDGDEFDLVAPADGSELVVLVKNRELSHALLERRDGQTTVDDPGPTFPDDIDHGLYMQLAASPRELLIPRRLGGGIANTGCACGVCGGGSGKPGGGL